MADISFECPKCTGHLVVDEEAAGRKVKCPDCGEPLVIPEKQSVPVPPPTTISDRSKATNPLYAPPLVPKTSDASVWSIVLGILSFLFCCFLLGLPAIICGHIARKRIAKSNGALKGEGIALTGLILGYSSFIATATLFIVIKAIELGSNIEDTKTTITILDAGVSSHKLIHGGKLPNSMNDILSGLPMKELSKDAFGADIVYLPDHATGTYRIISPGPDGKLNTSDDISNE
jgi:hypothetical protein